MRCHVDLDFKLKITWKPGQHIIVHTNQNAKYSEKLMSHCSAKGCTMLIGNIHTY